MLAMERRLAGSGIKTFSYIPFTAIGAILKCWTFHCTQGFTAMAIHAINTRNQLPGRIVEIVHGPVVSEVDVETASGIVSSIVTSRSLKALDLQVGQEVLAVFKSTEVLLARTES
jgi:molybdopterin-binding protein